MNVNRVVIVSVLCESVSIVSSSKAFGTARVGTPETLFRGGIKTKTRLVVGTAKRHVAGFLGTAIAAGRSLAFSLKHPASRLKSAAESVTCAGARLARTTVLGVSFPSVPSVRPSIPVLKHNLRSTIAVAPTGSFANGAFWKLELDSSPSLNTIATFTPLRVTSVRSSSSCNPLVVSLTTKAFFAEREPMSTSTEHPKSWVPLGTTITGAARATSIRIFEGAEFCV